MIKAAYRDGAFDPLLVPASISMELHRQASPEDGLEVTAGEPQRLPTAEGRVEGSSKCHQHQEMMVKHGYHLVPTYAFGQNELYTVNQTLFAGLRAAMQRRFKVSIPIFWGAYGTNMPHPVKITLAIGNPIKVPKPPPPSTDKNAPKWEPDPELVARLHAEYVAEVKALFERHKAAAGYADRELKVVAAGGGGGRKPKDKAA